MTNNLDDILKIDVTNNELEFRILLQDSNPLVYTKSKDESISYLKDLLLKLESEKLINKSTVKEINCPITRLRAFPL